MREAWADGQGGWLDSMGYSVLEGCIGSVVATPLGLILQPRGCWFKSTPAPSVCSFDIPSFCHADCHLTPTQCLQIQMVNYSTMLTDPKPTLRNPKPDYPSHLPNHTGFCNGVTKVLPANSHKPTVAHWLFQWKPIERAACSSSFKSGVKGTKAELWLQL